MQKAKIIFISFDFDVAFCSSILKNDYGQVKPVLIQLTALELFYGNFNQLLSCLHWNKVRQVNILAVEGLEPLGVLGTRENQNNLLYDTWKTSQMPLRPENELDGCRLKRYWNDSFIKLEQGQQYRSTNQPHNYLTLLDIISDMISFVWSDLHPSNSSS